MQFNYALEGALTKANVRSTKAVKALLNLENIKIDGEKLLGLDEQLTAIKESDGVPCAEIYDNRKPDGSTIVTGLTNLFAAKISLGGFHGVTVKGDKIIKTYLPDLNAPGAVKTGEVEMVAAVALKKSRSAGVLGTLK